MARKKNNPPPKTKVKSSIQKRLLINIIFILALLMIVTTYMGIIREKESILTQMKKDGIALAKSYALSAENSLLLNGVGLSRITGNAGRAIGIKYLQIIDKQGTTIGHTDVNQIGIKDIDSLCREVLETQITAIDKGEKTLTKISKDKEGNDILRIVLPLVALNSVQGALEIALDMTGISEAIQHTNNQSLQIALAAMLCAGIYIWLFASSLVKPIKMLVTAAGKVASGDLDHEISITTKDEIGHLAVSFNHMTEKLREYMGNLEKTNKDLAANVEQLKFLNAASFELAQYIQIEELLPAIIRIITERFGHAEASLCQKTENGFSCIIAIDELNTDSSKACSEKALTLFTQEELLKPFCISDWTTHDRLKEVNWQNLASTPCYISLPLIADKKCIAVIQIFTSNENYAQYTQNEMVYATLSAHAAVCLSNVIHYKELGEKARLDGELNAAKSIQHRLTPNYSPSIPRVKIKGVYAPAHEVGGDYLDYFQNESGDWIAVIADICGKGIPAALLMTMLRSIFHIEGRSIRSAKQLICAVNDFMVLNLEDKSFISALCLIIKNDGTSMSYARAGHPLLLKIDTRDNIPKNIQANGVAIGLVRNTQDFANMLDEVSIPLEKGDRFIAYTDGLTEAWNPKNNFYGINRLFETLTRHCAMELDTLIEQLQKDLKEYLDGTPPHDDLTILAMEVEGESAQAHPPS